MERFIDYINIMAYIPHVFGMLKKDKNGMYRVDMQKYGDIGFTWLGEKAFKLLQLTFRAITKQDKLVLDYTYTFGNINEDDIVSVEGDLVYVVWDAKKQEYIEEKTVSL